MKKQEFDIEEIALIAKSLGQELRFKLYKILLENKNRAVSLSELSKITGSSHRNVQVHMQILANAGVVEIVPNLDPISVRILKSVHFFEMKIEFIKKSEIDPTGIPEYLKDYLYAPKPTDYNEITDEESIVKTAKGLGHPVRVHIMAKLSVSSFMIPLSWIEKSLKGKPYGTSYYNIKQHVDKMEAAGIVHVIRGRRDSTVYLDKIIKIETWDVK